MTTNERIEIPLNTRESDWSRHLREEREFFERIKVGDEVAVYGSWGLVATEKVTKITPSGLIDVNGSRYDAKGQARGSERGCIKPVTDEIRETIAQQAALSEFRGFERDIRQLPAAVLIQLNAIIRAHKAQVEKDT